MRTGLPAALPLLLAACAGSSPSAPPPADPGAEVPRGPVQLLVERVTRGGARDLLLMEPDGSRVAPFAPLARDVLQVVPSPDGRTLAQLVQQPSGDVHLWLADRDGGGRRPLLAGDGLVVESVAWSPDAARLAVGLTTATVESDVFLVKADGAGLVDLTPDLPNAAFFDSSPAWSPDGSRILFSSNRSGTYTHLWSVPAAGGEPQPLLPASQDTTEHHPAWSPDGSLVAFLGGVIGQRVGIGLVTPGGQGYRVLSTVGRPEGLAWSPDGRLLYASAAGGAYDLYALDPVSGASTNLTGTSVDHELRALPLRAVARGPWRGFGLVDRTAAGRPSAAALALADLDGDGAPDLASLHASAGELRLQLGQGDGTLRDLGALQAPPGPRSLLAARVDGGGAHDLAVLGESHLAVWRGGAGGPGLPELLPLGGLGRGLAAGDFHWTGRSQLAALVEAGDGSMRLAIFGLDGNGALTALVDAATSVPLPAQACAADFTGEGSIDLLATTRDPAAPVWLVAAEGISFLLPVAAPSGVAVDPALPPLCADLDGDRRADLVLVRPGLEDGLAVLRSTGAGLGPAMPLRVAASAAAAGDVDRDGDLDLVVARETPGALLLLRNLGDGRFAAPAVLAEGGAPRALALADLDGDGLLDLAVADADGSLSTWRNLGWEPAP